jgi:hypothetical protein
MSGDALDPFGFSHYAVTASAIDTSTSDAGPVGEFKTRPVWGDETI